MKKISWIVAIVVLVLIGAWIVKDGESQSVGDKTIKIGSILPLSGDFGFIGEEIKRGTEIALDEARSEGISIEYVSEDDAFDKVKTASAANKLISIDQVDVAYTATVNEAKPILPLFEKSKVPFIISWDSTEETKTAGSFIFNIGFSAETAAKEMSDHAFKNLSLRKVALVYQIDEWSQLVATAFKENFRSLGGEIVLEEKVVFGQTDYRTVISKIKSAGVDGIYFPLVPPSNGHFILQTRQLGVNAVLMTGDSFLEDEIVYAGAAAEGVYMTNAYADETDQLLEKYKAKYQSDPASILFVAFGYDPIQVIIEAHKISQSKNISLRDALTRVKIKTSGAVIDMRGTQYSERVERLYQIKNGKQVEVN